MSNTYGAVYYPPLENLPTFDVLVFRNAQDVTDYAINSENSLITNTTSGTPYYPTFVDTSSGYERIRTNDPSYTYNATTNTISANTSGTAAVASQVVLSNTASGATNYLVMSVTNSGTSSLLTDNAGATYDSTNNTAAINISGTAAVASTITIADDDTANTYYLTFASAGVGNKSLLYDSITTPLSYVPSTNTLTINNLSSVVAITPSNARSVLLNGTPFGNFGNTSSVVFGVGAGPVGAMPNNCFCFGSNSGANLAGGVQNLFIGANSGNLVTSGRSNTFLGPSAGRKTQTGQYNTQIGAQSQSFPDENLTGSYNTTIGAECHILVDGLTYSTAIGANVVASTSNTVRIGRSADTTIFDGLVTNTIAQPAAGDSSTKMPTTAWVQTAITAGSVTTTANIALTSDDTSGTYYLPFSKTTSATSNALYIDNTTTPLTYDPSTSTLTATNFTGLISNATNATTATNATNVALTSDNTSGTYYLPFSKTTSATSNALYIDNTTTPLTYDPSTSTLTATNFTGLISNATNATTATNATNVALTSDDTSGTYYIPFSKTTSPTSNTLYIDDATTPLVYNPSNNEISTSKYSLGGLAPVSGANAGFFSQNTGSSASVIQNQATSGFVFLNTRTALNALTTSLSVSSTAASFNAANVTLSGTSINVGQGAGGTSNLIIGASTPSTIVFTTGRNTLIGSSAGQNMTAASDSNTLIGNNAGLGITSSTQNTFVGYGAGNQASGTGAGNNVAVGFSAGAAMITTATQNTLCGVIAASGLTTGSGNCIYGFGAASALLTGTNNSIFGLNAGNLVTGSSNIVIGTNAEVPTVANSNQIAIGTVTETMFLQGGFNLRVGTQITSTATGNLATAVLAQFYTVAMTAAAQTIALPNPTGAAYRGATVTFKRKTNTTVFTLTSTGGAGFVPIGSITLSASPHSVAAGIFQVTLVCDAVNWCIINQA